MEFLRWSIIVSVKSNVGQWLRIGPKEELMARKVRGGSRVGGGMCLAPARAFSVMLPLLVHYEIDLYWE